MEPVSTIIVCRRAEKVRDNCRTGAEKTFSFSKIPLDKKREMVYNICVRGYSLMVKLQLPKLATRVRFPLPAPIEKGHLWMSLFYWNELRAREPASNRKSIFSIKYCWSGLLPNYVRRGSDSRYPLQNKSLVYQGFFFFLLSGKEKLQF